MQTFIRWPMETDDGDYLLYLLETPRVVRGEGECWAEDVNPFNVTLDSQPMDDTVLEQLAMEARLRQRNARLRRQVAEQYVEQIDCGEEMLGCTVIRCDTGAMADKDDSVIIQIRSRVFTNTLIKKQAEYSGFRAKSNAVTSVVSLPYNVRYEVNAIDTFEVETFVAVVGAGPVRRQIQFWVIILAIVGGCLLLFLIVIILWKLGFFKRRRPEDEPPMYKAVRNEEF